MCATLTGDAQGVCGGSPLALGVPHQRAAVGVPFLRARNKEDKAAADSVSGWRRVIVRQQGGDTPGGLLRLPQP